MNHLEIKWSESLKALILLSDTPEVQRSYSGITPFGNEIVNGLDANYCKMKKI